MFKRTSLVLSGALIIGACVSPARAADDKPTAIQKAVEEYGKFFRPPTTPLEYWAAMRYEMAVGKYGLANTFLKGFLDQKPTDQDLLKIEQEEGMAGFLRLSVVPEMRATARPLIQRVTEVVRKRVSDPVRIAKYIGHLNGSKEEHAYALDQLRAAGPFAVPYMIQAIRETDDLSTRGLILASMRSLYRDSVPPVIAFLEPAPGVQERDDIPVLRVQMIQLLQARGDERVVPSLWYLAASPIQPDYVRQAATRALAAFEHKSVDRLPPANIALTRLANDYYEHKVRFPTDRVTIWQWTGNSFVLPPTVATPSQAEEYYGVRFAKQALDLDRRDRQAQVALLSLALEKAVERAGLDRTLAAASRVHELVKVVNPELLMAVLDRALAERRLPTILGAVRALGDMSEVRALRGTEGKAPVLIRALHYPDRRVQMAAADAILRVPAEPPAAASGQVVEVLRRALGSDSHARAIVADGNGDRASAVARAVRKAGYDVTVAHTGRELVGALQQASDVDVVLVDHALPAPQLPWLLGELRSDIYSGLLPVLVTLPPKEVSEQRETDLRRFVARYRNVWLADTTLNPDALKRTLALRIAEAGGKALSSDERTNQRALAMLWLKRIATGEKTGYDIRPAEEAILEAMRSPDVGILAIEAAGRLPDSKAQQAIADIVLTGAPKLKPAAAAELARHIQRTGLVITPAQRQDLEAMFTVTQEPALRSGLARLLGVFRPDGNVTGLRLEQFSPPPLGRSGQLPAKK